MGLRAHTHLSLILGANYGAWHGSGRCMNVLELKVRKRIERPLGSAEFAYTEKPAISFLRFNCSANAGNSPRVKVSGTFESIERLELCVIMLLQ